MYAPVISLSSSSRVVGKIEKHTARPLNEDEVKFICSWLNWMDNKMVKEQEDCYKLLGLIPPVKP